MDDYQKASLYSVGKYFRDLADDDYLSARLLFKNGFHEQFLILGQQSVEKYLKSILIFRLQKIKNLGHDLSKLFEEVYKHLDLKNDEGNNIKDTKNHIVGIFNGAEHIKYGVDGSLVSHESIIYLDRFVFYFRGYCLSNNHREYNNIFSGKLEKIMKKRNEGKFKNEYNMLCWKNQYWGKNKKTVNIPLFSSFKNPIFWGNKELDFLKDYIKISPHLEDAFRKYFNQVIK